MLNPRVQALGPYASKSIARRVESDSRVISLSIGEPAFGPPPAVGARLEEIVRAKPFVGELKRYEVARGSSSLRQAISGYSHRFFGLAVDPDRQVLVTHGGAGALTAAILAVSNPGDEVLIGDPSYMLYERLLTVLGRTPRRIPRKSTEGYRYDLDRVASLVVSNTAAIIVNSPENPTGYVSPDDELLGLVAICERNGMTFIHDEVYDQWNFTGRHTPSARLAGFGSVAQVNSMSKKFGVPGLRVGWLASSEAIVGAAAKAQEYTMLAVNSFSERVAEALLECPDVEAWFGETRSMLKERVALVEKTLSPIPGIEFRSPVSGGMFAFPTVSALAQKLHLPGASPPGDVFTEWLLAEAGVAVVPGGVYGREGEGSIRLVVSGREGELREALSRIETSVVSALEG